MKRISLILLSLLMIVTLVSCGDDTTPKDKIDLSNPELSITECYTVPYQYDLTPYIDITADDYIGLEIPKFDATVTDEDVNNAIFADLQSHSSFVDVDREAKNGDKLVIDFTGSVDGIEFDGGAAEDYEMILGSANLIPGFEDALVGHKAGEEFVIDLTFPEDYGNVDYQGKAVQFAITLDSVKEEVLPEFNETFIKENYECDTVEAYLALKQEELIAAKAEQADYDRQVAALETLYEKVEFKKYPETEYAFYYNDFVNFYKDLAQINFNMDLETYITDYCNSTEDEFYKYASMNAAISVEQELICFAIANEQKLWQGLKKADYDAFIAEIAEKQGVSVAEYEAAYGSDSVWTSLILDKALDFIVEKAVEVDTPAEEVTEETTEDTTVTE